ncbi:MAG: DNA topoisomerase 4 subunit A, partial [Nanoarchaeota archaeon]|nr:DNA topoisomerase 4 subunit A [Nanoarchaeota archaeon]
MAEGIKTRLIEDEMKESYIDYAMSVIVGRALPDVRDGLKPVHRRVLFTMQELSLQHNKPFKKSARIVGDCLGKYHPHGDSAVYFTLVRMAQDFSLRYPLVNGQGNWGSIDGDSAASMRYTEAKMEKIAEEMLVDIDKETVDFIPNFDGSMQEPTVLPSRIPNLLINGSTGIAVGMATNIPPHNIIEITDATLLMLDNPETSTLELCEVVKGPDFPTGGIICGTAGIRAAYKHGRGKIRVRAKAEIEDNGKKNRIIITEIPYMVNKSSLIEHIADQVNEKLIDGISDIRDESDRQGMRVVIELKKEINPEVVLNQLYKRSAMQTTFGINMLALHNNQPKVMGIKDLITYFIEHRKEVIIKRSRYELRKAEERAHILEGLKIALQNIEEVVQLIKKSASTNDAKSILMQSYELTEVQTQAILDMKLQKLTSLEQDKLIKEIKDLLKLIEDLKDILASEKRVIN